MSSPAAPTWRHRPAPTRRVRARRSRPEGCGSAGRLPRRLGTPVHPVGHVLYASSRRSSDHRGPLRIGDRQQDELPLRAAGTRPWLCEACTRATGRPSRIRPGGATCRSQSKA
jgi:hypothetical protein